MDDLQREAVGWIAREGELVGEHRLALSFNMRYPGQAYEIEIAIPPDERGRLDPARLSELFHDEHHRLYGFSESSTPVQTTTVRLGVIGLVEPVQLPDGGEERPTARTARRVWRDGARILTSVYDRRSFGSGAVVQGPAIIEQPDTTTQILAGWQAEADRVGTLRLTQVRK
jgi:N-methylhydantoinase A